MVISSGTRIQMARVQYLFIDGGYLREVIERVARQFFQGQQLPVDHKALSRGFTKCFYYDCMAPRKKTDTADEYQQRCEALQEHFRSLRMIDGWHVFEGVLTGSGAEARQKQVDIQIAVDMLAHSHRRNMDEITFIAGDQDFKPLVDALVREGMYVRLWYEPRSASRELVLAADARRPLGVYDIHSFLTQKFRREWELPIRSSQPGKNIKNAELLERGTGSAEDIELWRLRDEVSYQITHVDPLNHGYYMHMKHQDLGFLKLAHESLEGTTKWSPQA